MLFTTNTWAEDSKTWAEDIWTRDTREEGLEKGLFTGSEGEFVIYRKADEPDSGSESSKESEESANNGKQ